VPKKGATRHWIPVESTVGSLAGDRFRRKPRRTPRAKFEMLQICCLFPAHFANFGIGGLELPTENMGQK